MNALVGLFGQPVRKGNMNLTLKWEGKSGDGKRAYVVAEQNDGWCDLRIEVDTDDCDSKAARAMMQEVIDRCNQANVPVRRGPPSPPVAGSAIPDRQRRLPVNNNGNPPLTWEGPNGPCEEKHGTQWSADSVQADVGASNGH